MVRILWFNYVCLAQYFYYIKVVILKIGPVDTTENLSTIEGFVSCNVCVLKMSLGEVLLYN